MLRLAHRILSQIDNILLNDSCFEFCKEVVGDAAGSIRCGSPIVVADNVEEFMYSVVKQAPREELLGIDAANLRYGGLGLELTDIPCVRPPFGSMFIEWSRSECMNIRQLGAFIKCFNPEDLARRGNKIAPECVGVAGVYIFHVENGNCEYDGNSAFLEFDRLGKPLSVRGSAGGLWGYSPPIATPLMAISFMSCKNVARRDVTNFEAPPDKWLRRQKQPKLRYHVLEINPMRETIRTEGQIEANGIKKALHICRGHFANFSEEKPLFGKYAGTFWRPAHVRGSADQGMVLKDYSVAAPG